MPPGTPLREGKVAAAVQQISELKPIEGIDFVGPLPADVQRVSTFAAGIAAGARSAAAARDLPPSVNPWALPGIYRDVLTKVQARAKQLNTRQTPEYAPARYAGHEAGEFFFNGRKA